MKQKLLPEVFGKKSISHAPQEEGGFMSPVLKLFWQRLNIFLLFPVNSHVEILDFSNQILPAQFNLIN